MTEHTHDLASCPGCDHILGIDAIGAFLGKTPNTLYKWSRRGYPSFPRRLRTQGSTILVTCRSLKAWMQEIER